ncbi:hypothetical protein MAPG_02427 [Magnaporthiopsis poae ATCC 64411]|uniref:Uncharacterized protein n=1 Tax=Magnaporthiopsis poae (strain ATCC 64411 / 73-15) TaxID=644358 RepID=A0A0C4DRB9_MAGP6|nr:hypothetical protein MAPG_02427 [Magnaporthiopsis poae ATCC 64411]
MASPLKKLNGQVADNDLDEVSNGYVDIRSPLMDTSCLTYQDNWEFQESYVRAGHCPRETADGEDSEKPVLFGVKIFLGGPDDPDDPEAVRSRAAPLDLAGFWLLQIKGRALLVLRPCEAEGGVDADPSIFKRVGLAVHREGPWHPRELEPGACTRAGFSGGFEASFVLCQL